MGSRGRGAVEKDLCLYLVEPSPDDCDDAVCQHVIWLLQESINAKIFSLSTTQACVVRQDLNSDYEFAGISWDFFKDMLELLREKKVDAYQETPIMTLLGALEMVSIQASEDTYTAINIMYYCHGGCEQFDEEEVSQLKAKIQSENFCVNIVFPNEDKLDFTQSENLQLLRREFSDMEKCTVSTHNEVSKKHLKVLGQKSTRPAPWGVTLELGSVKIDVNGYVFSRKSKTSEMKKAFLKNTPSSSTIVSNESQMSAIPSISTTAIASTSTFVNTTAGEEVAIAKDVIHTDVQYKEADGTVVSEDEIVKAFFYADQLVPYGELEEEDSYDSGEKCLKLLLFCPKQNIHPILLTGDGITLFYPKKNDQMSANVLDALIKTMHKLDRVAVVRKVYRKGSRVNLGILSPNVERNCLNFIEIGYADDMGIPAFPPLFKSSAVVSDDANYKASLMDQFILSKSLDVYLPLDGPANPTLRNLQNVISRKVLGSAYCEKPTGMTPDELTSFFQGCITSVDTEQLNLSFPLKLKAEEAERPSGFNIFGRRQRESEDQPEAEIKKLKLEQSLDEPIRDDGEQEQYDADDLDYLYAFDFDHTIIDGNSDILITSATSTPIPDNIKHYMGTTKNWTGYMDQIFAFLHKEGVSMQSILECVTRKEPTPEMEPLLQRIASTIKKGASNFIVVSDANGLFIDTYFKKFNPPVIPDYVVTNPARVTEDGRLTITPYEQQSECPICPANLCKGTALQKYIETEGPFKHVYYVGDGYNDICPALKLSKDDTVFVRKGYNMEKTIQAGVLKNVPIQIHAHIVYWDNANTISNAVKF